MSKTPQHIHILKWSKISSFLYSQTDLKKKNNKKWNTLYLTHINFIGTGTVYVIVEDINDHTPIFDNDVYEFSLKENSPIGHQVAQVEAIDKDADENGQITYELIGSDDFTINDKGVIFSAKILDREAIDSHEFEVVARDSSKINPRSSSALVTISILDENDNRPTFDSNSTDYFIPPGLKSGDFVLGIFASDKDTGENARYFFIDSVKEIKVR